jgi:hypothetical protein
MTTTSHHLWQCLCARTGAFLKSRLGHGSDDMKTDAHEVLHASRRSLNKV